MLINKMSHSVNFNKRHCLVLSYYCKQVISQVGSRIMMSFQEAWVVLQKLSLQLES